MGSSPISPPIRYGVNVEYGDSIKIVSFDEEESIITLKLEEGFFSSSLKFLDKIPKLSNSYHEVVITKEEAKSRWWDSIKAISKDTKVLTSYRYFIGPMIKKSICSIIGHNYQDKGCYVIICSVCGKDY